MKKLTNTQLEGYKLYDKLIKDEVQYELVLRAVRKLSGPIGEESDLSPAVAQIHKALQERVQAYEQKEYPFGQANFKEWAENLTEEKVENKLEEIGQAEDLVDRLEAFEQARADFIRRSLKMRNLKQQALVQILHMDKTHVSHLMKGRKPFTVDIVSRLHYSLGVPFEYMIPPLSVLEKVKK